MEDDLLRLSHTIMDGTPGALPDPESLIPFAQVDVTLADDCRITPKK